MYLDDSIADILVNRTHIFANIHPNIITSISLLCNVVLYFILARAFVHHRNLDVGIFTVVLLTRCLTDILDGAVARKYTKTSQIGGLLDTLGDVTFIVLMSYFMCVWFNLSSGLCWVLAAIIAYIVYAFDIYHDHAAVKEYEGHIGRQALAFVTNNTVIGFAAVYVFVMYAVSHTAPSFEGISLRPI
jgi:phosphatidylglycerophosphate synthase